MVIYPTNLLTELWSTEKLLELYHERFISNSPILNRYFGVLHLTHDGKLLPTWAKKCFIPKKDQNRFRQDGPISTSKEKGASYL